MSFTDDENKNIGNQEPAQQKRVILTSADQISDDDVVEILRGKKKITEVRFNEAAPQPEKSPEEPAPKPRQKKTRVTYTGVDETEPVKTPAKRKKASLEETASVPVEEINFETIEEPKPKKRTKAVKVEEIDIETLEEPKPKKRTRAVLAGGTDGEIGETPKRRTRKVEAVDMEAETEEKPKRRTRKVKPVEPAEPVDVNINVAESGITESAVAASLEETAAALRSRIFGDESSKPEEKPLTETQKVRIMEVQPSVEETFTVQRHTAAIPPIAAVDYVEADNSVKAEDCVSENTQTGIKIEPEQFENNVAATTRYNSEMVIEELKRTEPEERHPVYESEFRRERREALISGYRPISTSGRVYPYGMDEIPDAVSQLTRRAKLNETLKVTSRAKKLEKAGAEGRIEPDCEEVITFEFEGISNAHVPLDNDSVFGIEGVDRYPGQMPYRRPPVTRGRVRKKGHGKKVRKPHGPLFRVISALLLVIIVLVCVLGYDLALKVCDDRAMDSKDLSKIKYTVDENTTDAEVAAFLVENGMVESEMYYKLRAIIFDADYKPGTYEISPSYSTEKIINILSGYDYSAGN